MENAQQKHPQTSPNRLNWGLAVNSCKPWEITRRNLDSTKTHKRLSVFGLAKQQLIGLGWKENVIVTRRNDNWECQLEGQ